MTEASPAGRGTLARAQLTAMIQEAIPGGSLLAIRQMRQGSSALAREVIVSAGTRGRRRLILRCFPVEWQGSPREKVERERIALAALSGSRLPVPEVLWTDPSGERLGYPALLQTRLPGRVSWRRAAGPRAAHAMGRVLAGIHAVGWPIGLPHARAWVRRTMQSEPARREWLRAHRRAEAIATVITRAQNRVMQRPSVLSHGDFNAGNVLWSGNELSGVVDWETAELAPAASDVGACRFDSAVTGGPDMAEGFLAGYGSEVDDLWFWELITALKFVTLYREWLPIWRRFGLLELDEETVGKRIDAAIEDALDRAG